MVPRKDRGRYDALVCEYPGLALLRDRRDAIDDLIAVLLEIVQDVESPEGKELLRWYDTLFQYNAQCNLPFTKRWPVVAKHPVCLRRFYDVIQAHGGFTEVMAQNNMVTIAQAMFPDLPKTCTNPGFLLSRAFRRLLSLFEIHERLGREPNDAEINAARAATSSGGGEQEPVHFHDEDQLIVGLGDSASAASGESHLLAIPVQTQLTGVESPKRGRRSKMAAVAQRHQEHAPSSAVPQSLFATGQVPGTELPSIARAIFSSRSTSQQYKQITMGTEAPVLASDVRMLPALGDGEQPAASLMRISERLVPVQMTTQLLRSRDPADLIHGARLLLALVSDLGAAGIDHALDCVAEVPTAAAGTARAAPIQLLEEMPLTTAPLFATRSFDSFCAVQIGHRFLDEVELGSFAHAAISLRDVPQVALAASGAIVWAAQVLSGTASPEEVQAAHVLFNSLRCLAVLSNGGGKDSECAHESVAVVALIDQCAAFTAILDAASRGVEDAMFFCRVGIQLFTACRFEPTQELMEAEERLLTAALAHMSSPGEAEPVAGLASIMLPPACFTPTAASMAAQLVTGCLLAATPFSSGFASAVLATVACQDHDLSAQFSELLIRARIAHSVAHFGVSLATVAPDAWLAASTMAIRLFITLASHWREAMAFLECSTGPLPPRVAELVQVALGQLDIDIARLLPVIARTRELQAALTPELIAEIGDCIKAPDLICPGISDIAAGVVHAANYETTGDSALPTRGAPSPVSVTQSILPSEDGDVATDE